MTKYDGKNVLIIGAARQGLALARFLVKQGAHVTLNDRLNPEQLEFEMKQLSGTNVRWVLGEHPVNLLDGIDFLCVSGGVPLTLPLIVTAAQKGIPITNDSQIFMEEVKAPVVGITGSAGKTTTTTIIGRIAAQHFSAPRKIWVGGNIGNPLIEYLADITETDLVILELSSFQLELISISPHLSAVLNITPNHLDRHTDMQAYIDAKSRILAYQKHGDIAVLNRDDPEAWKLRSMVRGRLVSFGKDKTSASEPQVFVQNGAIWAEENGNLHKLVETASIKLRGAHNLLNVLAACSIAWSLNFTPSSIKAGIEGFNGVDHRLQLVRELNGVRWYNDSIATAPERTIAALLSFDEPLILLLGGRDKNLPWEPLAKIVHQRVEHVILFGEAVEKIAAAIEQPKAGECLQSVTRVNTLQEALEQADRLAIPGDTVLLSPGGTSYDAFKDFAERGEAFINWVNSL